MICIELKGVLIDIWCIHKMPGYLFLYYKISFYMFKPYTHFYTLQRFYILYIYHIFITDHIYFQKKIMILLKCFKVTSVLHKKITNLNRLNLLKSIFWDTLKLYEYDHVFCQPYSTHCFSNINVILCSQ